MARRQQPVPLLARRGQCTVMTTALLHSAWLNRDSAPRKGMHFAWAGLDQGILSLCLYILFCT